MIRRRLLVLSAILVLVWAVGMFIFHNTLDGYLHILLLLAINSALFCVVHEEKQKVNSRQTGAIASSYKLNKSSRSTDKALSSRGNFKKAGPL